MLTGGAFSSNRKPRTALAEASYPEIRMRLLDRRIYIHP